MATVARTAKSNLLMALGALILTSCAQVVRTHVPAPIFMTGEAQGELFKGGFQLIQQGGTEGRLELEADSVQKELSLHNNVSPLTYGLDLGIFSRLDAYLRSTSHESPGIFGGKFQILGAPRSQAGAGNHALAITLGGGSSESNRKSDDILDDDEDYDFEADSNQSVFETSLIYSVRTSSSVVIYSSLRFIKNTLDVEITKSSDPDLEGQKADTKSDSKVFSLGAVLGSSGRTELSVEASVQETNWTKNDPTTFAFVNAAIGWRW